MSPEPLCKYFTGYVSFSGIPASAMPRIVLPPSLEEISSENIFHILILFQFIPEIINLAISDRATPEELALISTAIDEAEMDNLLNYEIEYSYAFYWRFFNYVIQNKRKYIIICNNNNWDANHRDFYAYRDQFPKLDQNWSK